MGILLSKKLAAAPTGDGSGSDTSAGSDSDVNAGSDSGAVVAVHASDEWNQHWKSHKQSNKLMVIDFSATWCGPCRSIEPAFKAMAAKVADVVFVKIDVDELPEVAKQHWKVRAMPTFVLVKRGKELTRIVGAKKDELEKAIEKLKS